MHAAHGRRGDDGQQAEVRRDQQRGDGKATYLEDVRSGRSQMRRPSEALSFPRRCDRLLCTSQNANVHETAMPV